MSKQMKMREIMKDAWTFVKANGMKLGDAMRCAYRNFKLKTGMLAGKAMHFTFVKADGSVREAIGTLAAAAINYLPNGNGHPAPAHIQRFWDLEKAAFRCFDRSRLVTVA